MLLSDLREVKALLEIDPGDKSEDIKLAFFLQYATEWISELLNRPGLFLQERTEVYSGTGTQNLLLGSRPVYADPAPRVWIDTGANFGSTSGAWTQSNSEKVYGTDFCLQLMGDMTKSKSGILVNLNGAWPKPFVRVPGLLSPFIQKDTGSVKITYTGGYSVDDLPGPLRLGCNTLVARMRYFFPLALPLGSESYEERNISSLLESKDYLLSQVKDMILPYRNWKF